MANSIKQIGGAPALQVTKPARAAGLVEEDSEGDVQYRADVLVHAVDDLLVVVDRDRVEAAARGKLIRRAIEYRDSTHRASFTQVQPKGHGYAIVLGQPAGDAGFEVGERAPVTPVQGALIINRMDAPDITRVVSGLETLRRNQVGV
jgi:hypothetical protein